MLMCGFTLKNETQIELLGLPQSVWRSTEAHWGGWTWTCWMS